LEFNLRFDRLDLYGTSTSIYPKSSLLNVTDQTKLNMAPRIKIHIQLLQNTSTFVEPHKIHPKTPPNIKIPGPLRAMNLKLGVTILLT